MAIYDTLGLKASLVYPNGLTLLYMFYCISLPFGVGKYRGRPVEFGRTHTAALYKSGGTIRGGLDFVRTVISAALWLAVSDRLRGRRQAA